MQTFIQHFQKQSAENDAGALNAGTRFFVIEDDVELSFIWERILRTIDPNAQIDWATSAEEARARLNTKTKQGNGAPYDLIIADIFLEGTETGLDLWRSYKSITPKIPIVITSAVPIDKYLAKVGIDLDFPPFLAKPFTVHECTELIESILGQSKEGSVH